MPTWKHHLEVLFRYQQREREPEGERGVQRGQRVKRKRKSFYLRYSDACLTFNHLIREEHPKEPAARIVCSWLDRLAKGYV